MEYQGLPRSEAGPRERVLVRIERCVGCRNCELACAVAHSQSRTLAAAIREEPRPQRRIYVEAVAESRAPFLCRHCDDAPCARACPTRALFQDSESGLVAFEAARCIGCHGCLMACPFGMIQAGRGSPFIVKCDRCPDRDQPACVAACPTGALLLEGAYLKMRRRDAIARLTRAARQGRAELPPVEASP